MPMIYHPDPPSYTSSAPIFMILLSCSASSYQHTNPGILLYHLINRGIILQSTPHCTITTHSCLSAYKMLPLIFPHSVISNTDPNTVVPTFSALIQQDSPLLNTQPQTTVQVDLHDPIRNFSSHYCVLSS